ncbi:MAG TPA: MraY family glycosyltransferase [Cyclobacteriaceae bacterium]|nr:undecaprenyl/decaprenyl-phosphate alpha-N-acetylglucosaminyl 1-phosphate transferase [Cyclobacteriaceae bacterium]HMV10160.1 MraY family glycosyltransferase [Cyclobacteriaceae bacterium]HMV90731.1 MraY family glycosyltransferase [Cyclobacteriaceae bacterium]HMX00525.1 MraY family glycosyltransferase [Cyclobacteriaceae bacterium]HMX49600.1 MraY family glycosyltransferase [Cyclobacteriaceae bacterium]
MATQLAAAVTSFVICFLIIPVIIKYSLEKNLVDIPGRRKIHKKITPSMGGIAIFIGFVLSALIWTEISHWTDMRFILIALFMVFFIGVRDDLVPLRPFMKLLGQIMAAVVLIALFDLRLKSLYGLFGIYEVPLVISYIITLFTIIVVTNSFNLIDGLDGLAGTIAGIALLSFGIAFYLAGDTVFAVLSFAMVGAVIAFLFFNWDPSEIFMGDTGALVIGMMLAISAIHFIDLQYNLPVENPYKFKAAVSGAVSFIMIPLADTLRIFILRIIRKQSPFTPDKSHIHHNVMRLGFSHGQSAMILGVTQALFVVVVVFTRSFNDNYVLLGLLILCTVMSFVLDRAIQNKVPKEN